MKIDANGDLYCHHLLMWENGKHHKYFWKKDGSFVVFWCKCDDDSNPEEATPFETGYSNDTR